MTHRMPKLRASALVAVGAIVVHQARFALAPDSGAPVDGHGYLPLAALLTGGLLALAGGRFLASLVRARRGQDEAGRRPSLLRLWVAASAVLVALYAAQESLEGLTAGGHPGAFGDGGLIALPLVVVVGALIALALAGARAVVARVARGAPRPAPIARAAARPRAPRRVRIALHPVARHLAGRGPPLRAA